MPTRDESFDRNEPVVPPPDDDDEDLDTPPAPAPGEHAEHKGRNIRPTDLRNRAVFPGVLTNR